MLPKLLQRLYARRSASAAFAADRLAVDGYSGRLVRSGVALGIVPSGRVGKDQLAVRIQDAGIGTSPGAMGELARRLESLTKGEVQIRYIGSVVKCSSSQVPPTVRPWQQCEARPILPGCSIGHFGTTAGSVGGFFHRDGCGSAVFILSNNHILANESRARLGDVIIQPAPADGGTILMSRVGTLAAEVPLNGIHGPVNFVDAAICEVDHDVKCTPVVGIGGTPWITGIRGAPLDVDDPVRKVGRSTEITEGTVSAIEVDDVWVDYDIGRLSFNGQIEIEGNGLSPFAIGGDSGSIVIDKDGKACGLLFAVSSLGGPHGSGLAFANPIDEVVRNLNLSLANLR